eukprot:CAMPEP_0113623284 /NCGR_PEP_ID=MMETSP0017_2-20120614/11970_1 /TAXON_ID=2856 /ORGANISM="Cylindrotheca closterium" /LENGTH=104 /DNA_ID=CAMNT_0000533213 /DNA_START=191 /DNA_END=505 /DNA_ORIENTATION=- /assembly_acc=CAM_ASM_000147
MTHDTNITETGQSNRASIERSQEGGRDESPPPRKANTTPPTIVKRYEKRISIDLMPMSLEEIEWAMGDCKLQEEEKEIQEIRERIQRRKKEKAEAAAAAASLSD